ncbi:hypothetical protein PF002_g11282 [Phytophthora fragariae]|uniref:Uncharacterized protein n=1 Tax=Phytophthora fragariae TaxID=53985 RepID=A0A6A3SNA5_9STRA|nr:hypothetical protein PF003_g32544 [Phytophthora fragariae]KAE9012715.1 hypothetical protein PF011_g8794 [Phytophthora fragariae]KAE9115071.1 hypothetical protein PF007_g10147 [Phytophthora fragariae]KAE9236279.1 hypothetical protein PF002_g11282 [Phytophthora fragariae]
MVLNLDLWTPASGSIAQCRRTTKCAVPETSDTPTLFGVRYSLMAKKATMGYYWMLRKWWMTSYVTFYAYLPVLTTSMKYHVRNARAD